MKQRRKIPTKFSGSLYATIGVSILIFAAIFSLGSAQLSGFAIASQGGEYSIESAESGGGNATEPGYQIEVYQDPVQGEVSGSGYILSVGSGDFLAQEDEAPVASNVTQSTSTPPVGDNVTVSAVVSAPAGLDYVIFYTNETGQFVEYERRNLTGTSANISFSWSKNVPPGTVVGWKLRVYDANGEYYETPIVTFVVGATDTNPPTISSVANFPIQPNPGDSVLFSMEAFDDFGLASAVLEVAEKNVSTVTLVGQSARSEFYYKPEGSAGQQVPWKIYVRDSSGKESASEKKTFALAGQMPTTSTIGLGGGCDETQKPKPLETPCVEGKRKTYSILCNRAEGKWELTPHDTPCLIFTIGGKQQQIDLVPIFVVILAIIIACLVYLYKKKPELFAPILEKLGLKKPVPVKKEPEPQGTASP